MKNASLLLISVALLAGCAEVIDERRSSIELNGTSYPVVTRTLQSGDRVYDVSFVRAEGTTTTCSLDISGDCEAAIRQALNPTNRGPS